MRKFLLLTSMVLVANVANAQTEYYVSAKMGLGDTTIYVDGDDKFEDFLIDIAENNTGLRGYDYDASGLLWEISPAIGIDWTLNNSGWFHIRLEGELGYNNYHENGKLKYNSIITDKIKMDFDQVFFLVNGYADFRIGKIVPYVGLGFGHGWLKQELTINHVSDSYDDHGCLWALHAGVAYKYSDITTFDLGLRYVYAPVEDDGAYTFTTVRLGTRFRI